MNPATNFYSCCSVCAPEICTRIRALARVERRNEETDDVNASFLQESSHFGRKGRVVKHHGHNRAIKMSENENPASARRSRT